MLCDAEKFLHELHKLFERKKRAGTVWVTMKRSNQKPRNGKAAATATPADYGCLIRATDGRRKLSTFLRDGPELLRFQASYALILRAQTDALKKRDKKKGQQQGQQGGKQTQQGKQQKQPQPPKQQGGGGGAGSSSRATGGAASAAGGGGGGRGGGGRK